MKIGIIILTAFLLSLTPITQIVLKKPEINYNPSGPNGYIFGKLRILISGKEMKYYGTIYRTILDIDTISLLDSIIKSLLYSMYCYKLEKADSGYFIFSLPQKEYFLKSVTIG